MRARVFATLEFDPIRVALASFTATEPARLLARRLEPAIERELIEWALADTGEARHLLDEGVRLSFAGIHDPSEALSVLAIDERVGDVDSLLCYAQLVQRARQCSRAIRNADGHYPRLRERVDPLPDLKGLEARIGDAIDRDTKDIRDDASEKLKTLRKALSQGRRRLQRALDSILQREETRKLLQDPIVTQRNGRAVVPVRAEFKPRFAGIIHGASTSGATVFVEPMATVELNNTIATTLSLIEEECLRIVRELTELARGKRDELAITAETLTELDFLQAKAQLSESMNGAQPQITELSELHLVSARHPLLIRQLRRRAGIGEDGEAPSAPVPISFSLTDGLRTLVLTGPNTGGKTVALKTAGLLALMVQAGLHVSADANSRFPVFQSVFADIGDEQSIGASLSTFSAHLKNIIEIDRELVTPALVILDEVGTGTDPGEGGALGTALVERFQQRGAIVLTSTHHHLLKAFATTTEGVQAASFAFDPKTYEPTYELVVGAAGRSMAFEMAARLGVDDKVVKRARQLQSERERQIGEMVEQLERDRSQIEREQTELKEKLEAVVAREWELETERQKDAEARRRSFEDFRRQMDQELAGARQAMKDLVAETWAKAKTTAGRREKHELDQLSSEAQSQLRQRALAPVARLADSAGLVDNAPVEVSPTPEALKPGDHVETSLGIKGELIQVLGTTQAEVRVRDKKLRVPIRELRQVASALTVSTSGPRTEASSVKTLVSDRQETTELVLIGRTVDEAIEQADKFLDNAVLGDYRQVRLVHGHGTGRLRGALRGWLKSHPLVAALTSETNDGATLVTLKD